MNTSRITRYFIYVLIIVAIIAMLWSFSSTGAEPVELPISELAQQIKNGEVAELKVSGEGREVTVVYDEAANKPDSITL
ncbi:MAG: hypothetical protein GWN04_03425, partial [Gammaproteobacteria bacterium]|nr:hypothetical protein [Gammaproteobacteria bacterium]NIQ74943.1 hypothetical protein [Gammaproteobacteria bacterium]NIX17371.1 hypothetical protein [Gammaproteobacteria bacterium]